MNKHDCLCPLALIFKLNIDISKGAYCTISALLKLKLTQNVLVARAFAACSQSLPANFRLTPLWIPITGKANQPILPTPPIILARKRAELSGTVKHSASECIQCVNNKSSCVSV